MTGERHEGTFGGAPINKTDFFIAPFISATAFIEHPLCFKHSLGRRQVLPNLKFNADIGKLSVPLCPLGAQPSSGVWGNC